jgi:nucleoside-diphosphate-sugar epimerase
MADAMKKTRNRPDLQPAHPRSYSKAILDLYFHGGRIIDALSGLRLPYFENVSFITADRVLDLARARDDLGYVPRVNVRDAVQRTVDWYAREGMLGSSGT